MDAHARWNLLSPPLFLLRDVSALMIEFEFFPEFVFPPSFLDPPLPTKNIQTSILSFAVTALVYRRVRARANEGPPFSFYPWFS